MFPYLPAPARFDPHQVRRSRSHRSPTDLVSTKKPGIIGVADDTVPGANTFSALPDGLAPRRTVVPSQPLAWPGLAPRRRYLQPSQPKS
jgi:hypothetical protein